MPEDTDLEPVGNCPFCNTLGLITGEPDWCVHYAGTYDGFMGSDPINCLTLEDPFPAFEEYLSRFTDLSKAKRKTLLAKMPAELAKFLDTASNNPPELFWLELIPSKSISADLSESLFETTYFSVFVENPAEVCAFLESKVSTIMVNYPL